MWSCLDNISFKQTTVLVSEPLATHGLHVTLTGGHYGALETLGLQRKGFISFIYLLLARPVQIVLRSHLPSCHRSQSISRAPYTQQRNSDGLHVPFLCTTQSLHRQHEGNGGVPSHFTAGLQQNSRYHCMYVLCPPVWRSLVWPWCTNVAVVGMAML